MKQVILVGQKVEQFQAEPSFRGMVGRVGTVEDVFEDVFGQVHCKTREDGVWCPARLLKLVS